MSRITEITNCIHLKDSKSTSVSKDEKFEMSAYIAISYITFRNNDLRAQCQITAVFAEICIEFDKVSKLREYIEIMHSQL